MDDRWEKVLQEVLLIGNFKLGVFEGIGFCMVVPVVKFFHFDDLDALFLVFLELVGFIRGGIALLFQLGDFLMQELEKLFFWVLRLCVFPVPLASLAWLGFLCLGFLGGVVLC